MEKLTAFLARKDIVELFAVRDAVSALAEIAYKTGAKGGVEGAIGIIEALERKAKKKAENAKTRARKAEKIKEGENEEEIRAAIGREPPKQQTPFPRIKPLNAGRRVIVEPIAQSLRNESGTRENDSDTIAKGEDLLKAQAEAARLLAQAAEMKKRKLADAQEEEKEKKEKALTAALGAIAAKKVAADNAKKAKKRENEGEKREATQTPAIKSSEGASLDMSGAKGATGAREKRRQMAEDFEKWWSTYPSGGKKGKPKALAAYLKARLKATHAELCKGRDEYAAFLRKNPDMPVKYGQGWLSEERWNDYSGAGTQEVKRITYNEALNKAAEEVRAGIKSIEQKVFILKAQYKGKWEEEIRGDIKRILSK